MASSERSGEAANAAGAPPSAPRPQFHDSEVVARPHRRRFNAEYKLSIIDQADSAQGAGAVGALLRREGLYSSHLATWRQAVEAGRVRRPHSQEAWPQGGCQSTGQGEPRTTGCECPLDEETEEHRVDHRGSKKSGCAVGQLDSEHPDRRTNRPRRTYAHRIVPYWLGSVRPMSSM